MTRHRCQKENNPRNGDKASCTGGKAPQSGDKTLMQRGQSSVKWGQGAESGSVQCGTAHPLARAMPEPPGHPNSSGCPPWAPPAQPSPKTRHILPKPRDKVAGWERQQQVSPVSLLPRVLAPAQSLAPPSLCQASSWHMLCLAKWLTASRGNPVRVPFRGVYSWGQNLGTGSPGAAVAHPRVTAAGR